MKNGVLFRSQSQVIINCYVDFIMSASKTVSTLSSGFNLNHCISLKMVLYCQWADLCFRIRSTKLKSGGRQAREAAVAAEVLVVLFPTKHVLQKWYSKICTKKKTNKIGINTFPNFPQNIVYVIDKLNKRFSTKGTQPFPHFPPPLESCHQNGETDNHNIVFCIGQ